MKNTNNRKNRTVKAIIAGIAAVTAMTTATVFFASANATEITSPAAQTQTNANGKHPGEAGYNFDFTEDSTANANGKHPGESGCCYEADKQ